MAIIVLIHPISSYYSQKYQTIYRKNTKRNATKTPNEMPQKYQMKCHKNTKRNATKIPNEMPQKHQTACVIRKKSVSLDKIGCTQK